jgi:hypothetical protein
MSEPLWTFAGYVTEAGGRVVQEWYDGLPEEEHDELQDTLLYLLVTKDWRRPKFDKVTHPLHEIRSKANQRNHEIRVYGAFSSEVRKQFTLLYGNEAKKRSADHAGQEVSLKRLSLLNQGKASTHEFDI